MCFIQINESIVVKKKLRVITSDVPAFGLLLLLVFSMTSFPVSFADDDEWDDDRREGFDKMEREREHDDDDDDDEMVLGGDISNVVLYGTIATIIGSVAYTGVKISKARKPRMAKNQ